MTSPQTEFRYRLGPGGSETPTLQVEPLNVKAWTTQEAQGLVPARKALAIARP